MVARWVVRALAVVGVLVGAWVAYPWLRARVLSVEETSTMRGVHVAQRLGCFACHGEGGRGGVPNPGSREGEVPAFIEQTQMMYVKSSGELREYVLDGMPARRRDDATYRAEIAAAAIHMPAYREFVTAAELDDLVAYLRAVSGMILPTHDAVALHGAEVVVEQGCFACHGPLGSGGIPNPGSFKGYVPGFWGTDFDELVHDDAELRQWITEGKIARIAEHPIGGRFFRRQAIKMPAYGHVLPPQEVEVLMAYVRWIRRGEWRTELR